jgi:signal transduction histidine kinase
VLKAEKIRRSFSPLYLAILSGVLITILIINGLLEIKRTRDGFYLLIEREAVTLIQHLEKDVQEIFASLSAGNGPFSPPLSGVFLGMEESIAEYLVEAAYSADQIDSEKPLGPSDLREWVDQYLLGSIEFYDVKGNLLKAWPSHVPPVKQRAALMKWIEEKGSVSLDLFGKVPARENPWFSVAIRRKTSPGIIALHLKEEQMRLLLRQFAVQKAVSELSAPKTILFVIVQDVNLNPITRAEQASFQGETRDFFAEAALQSRGRPMSRLYRSSAGGEIFEVAQSFSIRGKPAGLIRIGTSPSDIHPVLSQIKKNVALSVLFFLVLGVSAIALIGVNQNHHFARLKQMEERIRLAERLSSLGHLAAGVSHEIRNPLNAISMGLQRLKREFVPSDQMKRDEYEAFTGMILKEVRRVNEIVEQFLGLARPFQLRLEKYSIRELLSHLISLLQEEASSQNITFRVEFDPHLPSIWMDNEKLTQAFLNIMKNGMQAMAQGGVLNVRAAASRKELEVTVVDSGSGISPEEMEKIFNYYYTTKEKGTGLGLPIAHRIIEAHEGRIRVESRVGRGTKVVVRLPIDIREGQNTATRAGAAPMPDGASPTRRL